MMLSENETQRYARQTLLPEVGAEGQLRLKSAQVLVVGAGGLGNPCAIYLAAAGVGTIGLIDDDIVSLSNLQRQILFTPQDIGKSKTESAQKRLQELNPETQVIAHDERLRAANAASIFLNYDWIVDATDNFSARALISRACLETGRFHIFAGISRFEGQLAVFSPKQGPCYRCLVPNLPGPGEVPNCAESGVIGAVAGVIGSLQALTTIKLILNQDSVAIGELSVFNGGMGGLISSGSGSNHARAAASPVMPMLDAYRLPERADCVHHDIRNQLNSTPLSADCERRELLARDEWMPERFWPNTPIWIDVRDENETLVFPIPGAIEIPLATFPTKLSMLSLEASYILFCQSGVRSQKAQDLMTAHGFQYVWNLRGGLNSNDLIHPEAHALHRPAHVSQETL